MNAASISSEWLSDKFLASCLTFAAIFLVPRLFAAHVERKARAIERERRTPIRESFRYPGGFFITYGAMGLALASLCFVVLLTIPQITWADVLIFGGPGCAILVGSWAWLRKESHFKICIDTNGMVVEERGKSSFIPVGRIGLVYIYMWDLFVTAPDNREEVVAKVPILLQNAACALAMLRQLSLATAMARTAVGSVAVPPKGLDQLGGNTLIRAPITRT